MTRFWQRSIKSESKTLAEQEETGIEVSTVDVMIASVARHHNLTLVTHSTND